MCQKDFRMSQKNNKMSTYMLMGILTYSIYSKKSRYFKSKSKPITVFKSSFNVKAITLKLLFQDTI